MPRVALAAVVVAGALLAGVHALDVTQWTVMSDELLYRRLSEGIASSLLPLPQVHGKSVAYPTVAYPLVQAPVFGLLGAVDAFRVAHAVNALLMASAAIPAFLLARRVASGPGIALLVAGLTVLVPWMAFTTVLMTENLGYPAFLWAVLAFQRALEAPGAGRDLVAAGAAIAAITVRPQFVVLGPVLVLAVLVHERGRLRAAAREHRVLAVLTVAGIAGLPLVRALLGNYGGQLGADLVPPGLAGMLVDHVAVIGVGVGIVPLVAGVAWLLATLARPASRPAHAFAVITAAATAALLLASSVFALRNAGGHLHDRYAFYVAPLLLVATAGAVSRARRLPAPAVAAAAVPAAAAILAYDFEPYALPWFVSPPSVFHDVLDGRAWQVGSWVGIENLRAAVPLAGLALVVGAVLVLGPRRRVPVAAVLGVPLAAFLAGQLLYVFGQLDLDAQPQPLHRGQDWVQQRVPDGRVGSIPGALTREGSSVAAFWDLEFWNPVVGVQFAWRDTTAHHTELGSEHMTLQPDGALDFGVPVSHVVVPEADRRFAPAGRRLARRGGLVLVALPPRPRAEWTVSGSDDISGQVGEAGATVEVYAAPGERRRVVLELDGRGPVAVSGGTAPVRARVAGRRAVPVPVCGRARLGVRFAGALLTVRSAPAGRCAT